MYNGIYEDYTSFCAENQPFSYFIENTLYYTKSDKHLVQRTNDRPPILPCIVQQNIGRTCRVIGDITRLHLDLYNRDFEKVYDELLDDEIPVREINHKDASGRTICDVIALKLPKPFIPHDQEQKMFGYLLLMKFNAKDSLLKRIFTDVCFNKTFQHYTCKRKYFYHYIFVNYALVFSSMQLSSWVIAWILDHVLVCWNVSQLAQIRIFDNVQKSYNRIKFNM
uniref:Uncharacterized protein n=1 Tax=viral metagenome TaxID=1070528 RepID=A0A6C0JX92_9ZZZZ